MRRPARADPRIDHRAPAPGATRVAGGSVASDGIASAAIARQTALVSAAVATKPRSRAIAAAAAADPMRPPKLKSAWNDDIATRPSRRSTTTACALIATSNALKTAPSTTADAQNVA